MSKEKNRGLTILVVEDIEETRDGIEKLLRADGYRVVSARDEEEAIFKAGQQAPHLLLVSLGRATNEVVLTASWLREQLNQGEQMPVVIFCSEEVAEGEEVEVGNNVYLTQPDNFNQLRILIQRLLQLSN
jgi:CheY-like chemotaxis protein